MRHVSYPIPIIFERPEIYRANENPLISENRRLCSLLERLVGGAGPKRLLRGFPWLTPVVGSGCLDLGDGPKVDFASLPEVTWQAVSSLKLPLDLGDAGLLVRGFAEDMARDRVHDQNARRPASEDSRPLAVVPSESAARLALATLLLTKSYYVARSVNPSPTTRSINQECVEILGSSRLGGYLHSTVLDPLRDVLGMVEADADGSSDQDPVPRASRALVRRIVNGLDKSPPLVRFSDVRLMTEVTWLALTDGAAVYPGWTELLLRLVMVDDDEEPGSFGPRPKITSLGQVERNIRKVLQKVTEDSWDSRQAKPSTPRESNDRGSFYDAIAHLLSAQASLSSLVAPRQSFDQLDADAKTDEDHIPAPAVWKAIQLDSERKYSHDAQPGAPERIQPVDRTKVPLPVAFVTSFDLELEMALWSRNQPFRVVLPALATSSRDDSARLLWLTTTFHPEAGMNGSEALQGKRDDWQLARVVFASGQGGELPTVVRLSGCPLIRLPLPRDLTDAQWEALGIDGASGEVVSGLIHSLTIDEYTSIRQSENEIFSAATGERGSGLPTSLLKNTRWANRAWVAFGVQIDDPGIRARMFSQLSAGRIQPAVTQGRPEKTTEDDEAERQDDSLVMFKGLAVNERIEPDAATALEWIGFDFALELDCGRLTKDIDHCAGHIKAVFSEATRVAREWQDAPKGHDEVQIHDARWQRAEANDCPLWMEES